MTKQLAQWRTGPTPLSQKLGEIPAGLRVVESEVTHSFPMQREGEWIPVAPKGYVAIADLTASTSGDYSESALAALREEGVRLREVNVELREKELLARKELDARQQQLVVIEKRCEDAELQLRRCNARRQSMEEKLSVCAEAVKHTVGCIDQFSSNSIDVEEVEAAGYAVADLLTSITECKEVDESISRKAAIEHTFVGQENEIIASTRAVKKIAGNAPCVLRVPLQTRNVALR